MSILIRYKSENIHFFKRLKQKKLIKIILKNVNFNVLN